MPCVFRVRKDGQENSTTSIGRHRQALAGIGFMTWLSIARTCLHIQGGKHIVNMTMFLYQLSLKQSRLFCSQKRGGGKLYVIHEDALEDAQPSRE